MIIVPIIRIILAIVRKHAAANQPLANQPLANQPTFNTPRRIRYTR